MAKTLIAFFSRRGENWVDGGVRFLPKGNNEVIVEKIKSQLPEADVFRIETVKKYSDDYMVCIEEAKQELRAKARPELTAKVENMDQYDTIILGYPNWWGVPPMAVFTFLESYDFSGKKIVPFCSHEGSGLGGSIRQIKMAVPGSSNPKHIQENIEVFDFELSPEEMARMASLNQEKRYFNMTYQQIKDWMENYEIWD